MQGKSVNDVMQAIREEWQPASGIVLDKFGSIFPPDSPLTLTDEALEKQTGISYNSFRKKMTVQEYNDWLNSDANIVKIRISNGVGGVGITRRDEKSLEGEIPGVIDRLFKETGKISFLGNGFSSVPLAQAEKYKKGQLSEPPHIVDYFDYALVREDLLDLKTLFEQYDFPFPLPLSLGLHNVITLCSGIREGTIVPVKYFFGLEAVPAELSGTNLAINCHGPPASTLEEQLSIIAPGGELYTNIKERGVNYVKPPYHLTPIIDSRTEVRMANIIRREA